MLKGLISMEHDKVKLSSGERKKLDKIKRLENKKNDLLLKRKRSKNTPKIKFNKSEENQLQDIKEKLRSEKKLTSSLRVKVTDTIIKKVFKIRL